MYIIDMKTKITKSSGNIFKDIFGSKHWIDKEKISNAIYIDMIAGRNPHRKIRRINEWPDKMREIQRKSGLVILHGDGKYIIANDYKFYECKRSHVPNRETLASMKKTMEGKP